ncbi:MAG: hypothetical protein IJ128_02470 [Firmicutes bacterium]|nr:hypothetical protein [Bacillota bacterium]
MNEIKNEQERIQRVVDLTATPEEIACIGSLKPEKRKQNTYYYEHWYKGKKRDRKEYLGTADSEATRRHIKLRMQKSLLKRAEANLKLLDKVQANYQEYDPQILLDALPVSYRRAAQETAIAPPLIDPRYQACVDWASRDRERNNAPFSKAATYAKDGTRVRSKGECIYYNLLQEYMLPFVYDCYLKFTDEQGETKLFCPDFVIRCLSGKLIIIEHLGRLDDLSYAIDFGKKCNWYIRCGFVLGKNFFVTSDDAHGGTDSQAILEVLEKVIGLFYNY